MDKGIGIAESDTDEIFKPFIRGTDTGSIQGTGLGLSIVKTAVEALGGNISFKSTLGRGTVFTVFLPLYKV
jgi:signal transduction histidine kinase